MIQRVLIHFNFFNFFIIYREVRIALIKMHLAATTVSLSTEDWCLLGDRVEGFSGSDLSNCTSDAMFEPVRELEHNAHWKLDKSKIASSTKKKLINKALVGKAWPGKASSAKIESGLTGQSTG